VSKELSERVLDGDARALARGISLAEEGAPAAVELLREIFPRTGRATVIGVTGAPGAGKSSLVDRLVAAFRQDREKVGVVAVDPSSAYSGGAILGDRVRMLDHSTDPGVFIRSMATRGHLGGLSRAANDAIDLLDAAGFDPILVETVGVGQDEVEVVKTADVVAVVLVPGMGDDVQAIKAGILEIADLFVINKADRNGADRLHTELDYMLSLAETPLRPTPEVLRTVATSGEGIVELRDGLERCLHAGGKRRTGSRRRERAQARFLALLGERILSRVIEGALGDGALEEIVRAIAERQTDPYTAVEEILSKLEVR
jgi:LAO/AO transport system kinase